MFIDTFQGGYFASSIFPNYNIVSIKYLFGTKHSCTGCLEFQANLQRKSGNWVILVATQCYLFLLPASHSREHFTIYQVMCTVILNYYNIYIYVYIMLTALFYGIKLI